MFGLTFDKLLIVAVIAAFVIGPERLPAYAAKLGQLVRSLRDFANGAKDRMRDEMGPEFDEVDWKKLDPRQYDPRRIIREALLEDPVTAAPPDASDGESATDVGTSASTDPVPTEPAARYVESAYEKRQRRLGKGRPAPYDGEAT